MSDYITEDIQLKILKHLPVKTLMRFRCVCKLWKQSIESQSFLEDHLALQKRRLVVEYEPAKYLVADPCKLPLFETLIIPIPEQLCLVSTLHGIICFYNQMRHNFLLWNPSIRKLTSVEDGPRYRWDRYGTGETAYGPCCGFWIDPLTKDFKIIMFTLYDYKDGEDTYDVYSSTRGGWKKFPIGNELELVYTKEVPPAVVMDGLGYWLAYFDFDADNEEQKTTGVAVLSFDFVKEMFLEPFCALSVKHGWNVPALCDLDGALSLVYVDPDTSCDILVRKQDEWVLFYRILVAPNVQNRCIWAMVEAQENDEFNILGLATTGDELIMFDNSESDIVVSWATLMSEIKESNVAVTNGFVESLLFPA